MTELLASTGRTPVCLGSHCHTMQALRHWEPGEDHTPVILVLEPASLDSNNQPVHLLTDCHNPWIAQISFLLVNEPVQPVS
ncbi:MAG: hypothetical protein K0R57_5666 [Paenibacillaceae bacterium]|nr:hypothetical protein [Paenibacillaceae bacterium]